MLVSDLALIVAGVITAERDDYYLVAGLVAFRVSRFVFGLRLEAPLWQVNTLQRTHVYVVKIAAVVVHVLHFVFDGFDDVGGKVCLLELLCAA